jgi:hypothetical protein
MKKIILAWCIMAASCCGTKKNAENVTGNQSAGKDTAVVETVQGCIKEMIKGFEKEEMQNPPRKIYSYTYQGSTVYYVTPPCCDFYSDLYDSSCRLIGHPDGGITGRGDGKFPDFEKTRSNEKLVWADKRKETIQKK